MKANEAVLTFKSTQSNQDYKQKFDRTYFSRSEGGDYDVVLLNEGLGQGSTPRGNGPIWPTTGATLNQVVHLRVLWKPQRGTRSDTPSATNAILDWYILTTDSPAHQDFLHYRGVGFAAVDESGDHAHFEIRNSQLQLAKATGRLKDPLGPTTLAKGFDALRNDGMVSSTLELLRDLPENSLRATTETTQNSPPPRLPAE